MQSFEIKKKPSDPADFNIYFLSESAITLSYNSEINNQTFNRISNLNETIYKNPFEGFQCTVPAYTSLTIFYDPMKVIKAKNLIGINCFEKISRYLYR